MDPALVASWRTTERLLRAAVAELPGDPPVRGAVRECLDHDELGLAFDELVAAGGEMTVPSAFWRRLGDAAAAMGLTVDDPTHGHSVLTVRDHLAEVRRQADES